MRRYVVVALVGGLGNQLFQYASGYGIATRVHADLVLDGARLEASEDWLPEILGSHYHPATRAQLLRVGVVHRNDGLPDKVAAVAASRTVAAVRRFRRMTPPTLPTGDPIDNVARYDETIMAMDLPTQLYGWFQSERYFENVADEVVERLRLPDARLPPAMRARPVVAVSFRRGDYVRRDWQLPFSYYERALDRMTSEIPDATFLVFGDDPEFVRMATDWMTRYGPATNAYDLSRGVLEHMVLAAHCDHAVIANSSFAWWGAWLGDRRDRDGPRLVLAPEDYRTRFGADILPDHWIALTSE
jgi:hypothetical protein